MRINGVGPELLSIASGAYGKSLEADGVETPSDEGSGIFREIFVE